MEKEEAKALASAAGSGKKKLTPTQLAILKDLAKGHEIADRIVVPIVHENPNELTLSPNNVRRTVNEKALEMLMTSIKEVGVLKPIFINTRNQVVVGNRRWLASKRLGLPSIPCNIKKYNNAWEEMMHSLLENDTQTYVTEGERAETIRKLHDRGGMSFQKIANVLGRSEESIRYCYEMKKEGD